MLSCCRVLLTTAGCPIVPMRGGLYQGRPARKIASADSSGVCMHKLHVLNVASAHSGYISSETSLQSGSREQIDDVFLLNL